MYPCFAGHCGVQNKVGEQSTRFLAFSSMGNSLAKYYRHINALRLSYGNTAEEAEKCGFRVPMCIHSIVEVYHVSSLFYTKNSVLYILRYENQVDLDSEPEMPDCQGSECYYRRFRLPSKFRVLFYRHRFK